MDPVFDLENVLNHYDALIIACTTGRLSFQDFLAQYGSFYLEYALDGHESDEDEQRLLGDLDDRIAIHREITETVLYRLTSAQFLAHPDAARHGLIDDEEGLRRVKDLARTYLNIA